MIFCWTGSRFFFYNCFCSFFNRSRDLSNSFFLRSNVKTFAHVLKNLITTFPELLICIICSSFNSFFIIKPSTIIKSSFNNVLCSSSIYRNVAVNTLFKFLNESTIAINFLQSIIGRYSIKMIFLKQLNYFLILYNIFLITLTKILFMFSFNKNTKSFFVFFCIGSFSSNHKHVLNSFKSRINLSFVFLDNVRKFISENVSCFLTAFNN